MNSTKTLNLLRRCLPGLMFLFCSVLTMTAQQTPKEKRDSLQQLIPTLEGKEKLDAYWNISLSYFPEVDNLEKLDTLIAIYDAFEAEGVRQNNIKAESLAQVNKLLAFIGMSIFDEVIRRAPQCIDFAYKNELWSNYYRAYDTYISAKLLLKQPEEALNIAWTLHKQAKDLEQERGIATAFTQIAYIYTTMGRHEQALPYYQQAIELMEKAEPNNTILTEYYYSLCQCLMDLQEYEKAEKALKTFEQVNQRLIEEHHLAETTGGRMKLLCTYMRFYTETEQFDKVEIYCDLADSIAVSSHQRIDATQFRMYIHVSRGEYAKALEMANKVIEMTANLQDDVYKNHLIKEKARILSKMGDGEEAFNLMEKVILLNDSIRNLDINKQLDELRTQYEVDRHVLEKERNRNYFYLALAGCLLLVIALAIWIVYSRRLRAKNRALYEQIQARNQCRVINENTLIRRPQEELSRELSLFRELSLLMKREKLFTDPSLDRRVLADRLGTNEKYIADAIQAGSQETLSAYITRLRLQYATELLESQPNLTLEAIAIDSGFSSYRTFFRVFSQTFGMTPRDYRLFAQRKED